MSAKADKFFRSNNTNKLSPQEHNAFAVNLYIRSNNTNKLSPQERNDFLLVVRQCSNNTNKLSPQEPVTSSDNYEIVQIIQINLVLKNAENNAKDIQTVQIIQINLVLKNIHQLRIVA